MNDISKIIWDGWKITRKIGSGGGGTVYEIERDLYGTAEKAALKVISIPQDPTDIDELILSGYDKASITNTFHSYMQNVVQEYSIMAEMKGNANIVYNDDIRTVQHDDGIGWDILIKMELLTPITQALESDVSEDTVIKIGMDICNALDACNKMHIIHRDIKPQNIFVAKDGTYKLGDFGIAKFTSQATNSKTMGVGTMKFMAPEVAKGTVYNASVDIYSLGMTLYWLLNKRRIPFISISDRIPSAIENDVAIGRRMNGELLPAPVNGSAALQQIVLKACAYDPNERYASAAEMRRALQSITMQSEPSASSADGHKPYDEEQDKTQGAWGKKKRPTPEPNDDFDDTDWDEKTQGIWKKKTSQNTKVVVNKKKSARHTRKLWIPLTIAGISIIAIAVVCLLLIKKQPVLISEAFSTHYYSDVQTGDFYGVDADGIYHMKDGNKTVIATGTYCYGLTYCTDNRVFYVLKNDETTQKRVLVQIDLTTGTEKILFEAPDGTIAGIINDIVYFMLNTPDSNDYNDNQVVAFNLQGEEQKTVATEVRNAYQTDGIILVTGNNTADNGTTQFTALSTNETTLIDNENALCATIADGSVFYITLNNKSTISIHKVNDSENSIVTNIELPDDVTDFSCQDDILVGKKLDGKSDLYSIESFCLYSLETGEPIAERMLCLNSSCSMLDISHDAGTGNVYAIVSSPPHGYMCEIYQLTDDGMQYLTDYSYFDNSGGVTYEGIYDGYLYYRYVPGDNWMETALASKKLPDIAEVNNHQLADYIGKSVAEVKSELGPCQEATRDGSSVLRYNSLKTDFVLGQYAEWIPDYFIVQGLSTYGGEPVFGSLTGAMTFPEIKQAATSEMTIQPPQYSNNFIDYGSCYWATVKFGCYELCYYWTEDPMLNKSVETTVGVTTPDGAQSNEQVVCTIGDRAYMSFLSEDGQVYNAICYTLAGEKAEIINGVNLEYHNGLLVLTSCRWDTRPERTTIIGANNVLLINEEDSWNHHFKDDGLYYFKVEYDSGVSAKAISFMYVRGKTVEKKFTIGMNDAECWGVGLEDDRIAMRVFTFGERNWEDRYYSIDNGTLLETQIVDM